MKIFAGAICLSMVLLGSVALFAAEPPASVPAPTAPAAAAVDGAKIQFETPVYVFGKGQSGEPVKHTFIFTNTGNAELVLTDVHPGCGCTTAGEWTKKVAPGATGTIPIVMASVSDPVGAGFVKSLAHPGGNITGLSNLNSDLGPKQLEMLRSVAPKLSRVAILVNPANLSHAITLKNVQSAGQKLGVAILPSKASNQQEIENAFSHMTRQKADAVIVVADQYFRQQRFQITALAIKHRILSILPNLEFAEAGGLMSYGPNVIDTYRRAATYVDKILKGAKPADLPVEQPTLFELVINGKTAKTLGLKIPQSLLLMANKVIE